MQPETTLWSVMEYFELSVFQPPTTGVGFHEPPFAFNKYIM